MMRKITICIMATALVLMIVGDCWNAYTRKNNQLKIYQEEIANQREEIRGLEDTMNQLIDRLEIFERTWDVIRGTDSATIDGLLKYIRAVRRFEYDYNEEWEYLDKEDSGGSFLC